MGSKCFALPNNHQVKNKHAFSMEDGGVDMTVTDCWQSKLGQMADFPPLRIRYTKNI